MRRPWLTRLRTSRKPICTGERGLRPVPGVAPVAPAQSQRGRGQQAPEKEQDGEPPLMRGNTVALHRELIRQVSTSLPRSANPWADHVGTVPPCDTAKPCQSPGTTSAHTLAGTSKNRTRSRKASQGRYVVSRSCSCVGASLADLISLFFPQRQTPLIRC